MSKEVENKAETETTVEEEKARLKNKRIFILEIVTALVMPVYLVVSAILANRNLHFEATIFIVFIAGASLGYIYFLSIIIIKNVKKGKDGNRINDTQRKQKALVVLSIIIATVLFFAFLSSVANRGRRPQPTYGHSVRVYAGQIRCGQCLAPN